MANIKHIHDLKTDVIAFSGEISSSNAMDIENELFEILNGIKSSEMIVFDFEDLTYISSAGLRVILKSKKLCSQITISNVSNEVYDVFEMTGFTSIIEVNRKFREISIEGLKQIGKGYFGTIYRLDDEKIVKAYNELLGLADIFRERKLAKAAFLLGIPTAISFEIVKVKEGGYGSIFELVNSDCLNKIMVEHPEDYAKYSKFYTDLLKTIIETPVEPGSLPDKKLDAYHWFDVLKEKEAFKPEVIAKLYKLVDELPVTNTLIHGDFHIKNVMVQGDEPILIDMDTLGTGHPMFEISAIFLAYYGYPSTVPGNIEDFFNVPEQLVFDLYRDVMNALFPNKTKEEMAIIGDKITLFSYAWLTYKTLAFEPENIKRLTHAQDEVNRLIDKVDSFDF